MNLQISLISVLFLIASLIVGIFASDFVFPLKALLIPSLLFVGWFLFDLLKLNVSDGRPFRSVARQHCQTMIARVLGVYMTSRLFKKRKIATQCQENLLKNVLKSNEATVFGKEHGFAEIKTIAEYKKKLPLSVPADYSPYVDRISKGESNILTANKISCLAVTSGTSGKASVLPFTKKQSLLFLLHGLSLCINAMHKAYPGAKRIQKSLKLMFMPKWRYTESGLRVGPVSSNPDDVKRLKHMYTTPFQGYEIMNEASCLYVHLLFALKEEGLGCIESSFASVVWSAVLSLRSNWDELVSNIESGKLSQNIEIEPETRHSLQLLLKPDPERAQILKTAMQLGRKGLFHRIWPELNVVLCTDTGPFRIYRQHLLKDELFGIPIYSPFYAASEGLLGVNIWPKLVCHSDDDDVTGFHLLPEIVFYEFIPVDKMDEKNPDTLLIHELTVGESYELVLTNVSGLYRYKINDVVRVIRYEEECPVVEYLYRKGTLLNVHAEKLSEDYFYRCLLDTMKIMNIELAEYCCVESPVYQFATGEEDSGKAPFYVVFIELLHSASIDSEALSNQLDEELCSNNYVYSSFRKKGSIGKPTVYVVNEGSFQNLRAHLLEQSEASSNQLKIPRVLKRNSAISLMKDSIK